jgi:hypothetical protein
MTTRAKFQCQRIENTKYAGGESSVLVFTAVTPYNSEDTAINKAFWEATPNGEIKITISNKKAVEQFQPGKQYYVDFTEIEEPAKN